MHKKSIIFDYNRLKSLLFADFVSEFASQSLILFVDVDLCEKWEKVFKRFQIISIL